MTLWWVFVYVCFLVGLGLFYKAPDEWWKQLLNADANVYACCFVLVLNWDMYWHCSFPIPFFRLAHKCANRFLFFHGDTQFCAARSRIVNISYCPVDWMLGHDFELRFVTAFRLFGEVAFYDAILQAVKAYDADSATFFQ